MTDATKLAESLRAMRRNAQMHYVAGGSRRYAIVVDHDGMLDLTEAATMLNVAAAAMAELAEWRSVFGHLGATPDDCGNAIVEARKAVP